MPTLTVTPQPSNWPPRNQLVVSGFTGTSVVISRLNSDGTTTQVRTANPGLLSTSAWFDHEMPYTAPATYKAVSDTGQTATGTAPSLFSLGVQKPWIVHVGIPALSMPITIAENGIGDRTRVVNQGVHVVLGRSKPVVRTDGVRRAPTFDLQLLTFTKSENDQLLDLVATGTTLLLQIQYPTDRVERSLYAYVSVGDTTDSWPSFTDALTQWTLPCTETSAPTGLQQAQWTYAGVLATYTSYADVTARYETYTDLLINNPRPA